MNEKAVMFSGPDAPTLQELALWNSRQAETARLARETSGDSAYAQMVAAMQNDPRRHETPVGAANAAPAADE